MSSSRSSDETTVRFYVRVGRLIKGQVRREITREAFAQGWDVDVREDMGLLDGFLYFTVRGKGSESLIPAVRKWIGRDYA